MIVGRERTATGGIPANVWGAYSEPYSAPHMGAGAGANEQYLWWTNPDPNLPANTIQPETAFFAGEVVSGPTEHFGATTLDLIFDRVTTGQLEAFGVTISPYSFNVTTAGIRETFGQVVLPLSFDRVTQALITAFGKVDLPLNLNIVTAGAVEGQVVVTPTGASGGGGPVLVVSPRDILEMRKRRLRKDEEEVIQILTYLGYLPE